MTEVGQEIQLVWRTLISVSKGLVEEIEEELKSEGLPPLTWYDILLEVEKAGKDGLRPYELQERLLLPQYGMSRLLDRIDAAGLIKREVFGPDKRGQMVFLTPEGGEMRRRIWKIYGAFLSDRLGARLSSDEAATLSKLLQKLR